ncbi:UNVERIFIED_CONTAM: hypothetical protein FKN15_025619 [Acipenser sinensis]
MDSGLLTGGSWVQSPVGGTAAVPLSKGVPGPGRYEIKSYFEKRSTQGAPAVLNPPFLSKTQRFAPVTSISPAPGSYNDPRTALQYLTKITGMKRSPFGLTAVRFIPESIKTKTPGPGAYNIFNYGLAQESLKKAYLESTRKGGFGSTATRSPEFLKRQDVVTPGPAQYQADTVSLCCGYDWEQKHVSEPGMVRFDA